MTEAKPSVGQRPVAPEDEPFLRRLFESVHGPQFEQLPLDDDQRKALIDMQFRAQRTHYARAYPDASVVILLVEGETVGSMTVGRDTEIRLVDISLLPEFRGMGIGTTVIGSLLGEAMAGGKAVTLSVECNNAARRLYEHLGFEATDTDGVYMQMCWSGIVD